MQGPALVRISAGRDGRGAPGEGIPAAVPARMVSGWARRST